MKIALDNIGTMIRIQVCLAEQQYGLLKKGAGHFRR
jgi:hypothetical protein